MIRLTAVALAVLLSPLAVIAADTAPAAVTNSLDPVVAGKGMYVFKSEDADARVLEVTFKPGQKVALHQHPKHIAYVLKGGDLKLTEEGKEPQEMKLVAGAVVFLSAQKHSAENTGKTTVKILVVELKGK